MKTFLCSIVCCNGIVGGTLFVNKNYITYKTNKVTVNAKLKKIELPINQICNLKWKWFILPIATLQMINGEEFSFIIFDKKGFENCFTNAKNM